MKLYLITTLVFFIAITKACKFPSIYTNDLICLNKTFYQNTLLFWKTTIATSPTPSTPSSNEVVEYLEILTNGPTNIGKDLAKPTKESPGELIFELQKKITYLYTLLICFFL